MSPHVPPRTLAAARALAAAAARADAPQAPLAEAPLAGARLPLAEAPGLSDDAYDHYDELEPPVRARKHSALGGSLGGINANMAQKRNGALKRVAAAAKKGIGGR